jgi:hypothetical protein
MTDAAIREIAEAVVELLVERGILIPPAPVHDGRVLSATEAARLLGRRCQWVYEHAAELGGFRYGTGRRARLGFDRIEIERWKHENQLPRPAASGQGRRRPPRSNTSRGANLIPFEPMTEGRSIERFDRS